MFTKIRKHTEAKEPFELKVFITFNGLSLMVAIISLLIDAFHETNLIDLIVDASAFIYFLIAFTYSYYKRLYKPFIYPTLLVIFSVAPAHWFQAGAVDTVGALIYIAAIMMAVFITPFRQRTAVVSVFLLFAIAFSIGDFLYDSANQQMDSDTITIHIYFVIVSIGIGYATLFLKNTFDQERQTTHHFEKDLKELHRLNLRHSENILDAFRDYLKTGSELLRVDGGLIVKKEWQKWRPMYLRGMAKVDDTDAFSERYSSNFDDIKNSAEILISDKKNPLSINNQGVEIILIAPIIIDGRFYGHLMFFLIENFPERIRSYDLELVELMAQNIGYLISTKDRNDEDQKTREALYMSELRFRNIFENADVGIVVTDINGHFLLVNPAFQAITGHKEEEIIQMKFQELIMDASKDDALKLVQLQQGEIEQHNVEHKIKRKDQAIIDVLLKVSVVKDSDQIPLYGVCIIEDVTQKKRSEKAINELNDNLSESIKKLEASNKELESFSYSISHDLRAPLRAINGFSKILTDEYGSQFDEEGKRLVNVISTNARKMGNLIDDLLSFSKLSRHTNTYKEINTEELINEILEDLALQYDISKVCEISLPLPTIFGDKALIRQALNNILTNSFKFSSGAKSPKVTVNAKYSDQFAVISISDNGIGFNMKYHDKIFKVFQRLHSDSDFPGTGVGLAIVKRIIQRHDGKIWATSEPGKGATFNIMLPSRYSAEQAINQ
ncbi:MAG: PAS domain S-box protein [Cyclobacteriaceae bacterium]